MDPTAGSLTRTATDPSQVDPQSNNLFQVVRPAPHNLGGAQYFVARLTDHGNRALGELCFTETQREVWSWPSYEFLVKRRPNGSPGITVAQV